VFKIVKAYYRTFNIQKIDRNWITRFFKLHNSFKPSICHLTDEWSILKNRIHFCINFVSMHLKF
jgi:hypothetical protein